MFYWKNYHKAFPKHLLLDFYGAPVRNISSILWGTEKLSNFVIVHTGKQL